jgi:RNA polymerase sigma-70 factor (ECF subfamily)
MVLAAGGDSTQASQAALETLCRTYWYPLYAYVRRAGFSHQDAQDLTQAFILRLLDKRYLAFADQSRGKFRTFLLSSMKHFLINERQKSQTARRGGGHSHVSIEADRAEQRYGTEPATNMTPEKYFEQQWAFAVIERALETLRDEYRQSGGQDLFEKLKEHLWGDKSITYARIAETFEMNEGAVKNAAFRLRRRFAEAIRVQIAETVASPDQVEDELNALLEVVR